MNLKFKIIPIILSHRDFLMNPPPPHTHVEILLRNMFCSAGILEKQFMAITVQNILDYDIIAL